MTHLPADTIRQDAQKLLDSTPSDAEYELGAACRGSPIHTDECLDAQEYGIRCIQDRLPEASVRLRGYRSQHWLKECLQNPERAQARHFLEQGLLQESFVYRHDDVSMDSARGTDYNPDLHTGRPNAT